VIVNMHGRTTIKIQRIFYGVQLFIHVVLLRTFRFPEIRTCGTTDELSWVINCCKTVLDWKPQENH
jgi:hypothetical protein